MLFRSCGNHYDLHLGIIGRNNHFFTVNLILFSIQFYTHEFQPLAGTPTGTCLVFTDTTCKYDDIHATQSSSVRADIFLNTVEIHVLSQDCFLIAGSNSSFQVTHITGFTEDTQHTALLVQKVGNTVCIQVFLLHGERNGACINITAACTHHQTFKRSQTHAGIHALSVFDGRDRATVSDVAGDDFLSLRLHTEEFTNTL